MSMSSNDVRASDESQGRESGVNMSYGRFAAMIATSMAAMFVVMYLNSFEIFGHARWSETRFYMTFLMGAVMATVMLAFMLNMYRETSVNVGIFVGSVVVFALALFLVRSQATVQDSSYMRAMIPHHSIAILTSERSEIDDLRVRALADDIIEAQRREIKEMTWLIDDIAQNGIAETPAEVDERPLPEFTAEP